MTRENLIKVKNLKKHFHNKNGYFSKDTVIKAVDGISFDIPTGKTTSLIGESGCGKSTVGRTIIRLLEATEGQVLFKGNDILKLRKNELIKVRKKIQLIFQDPYASLNQRQRIYNIIAEPILYHNLLEKSKIEKRVNYLLEVVGLNKSFGERFPHELSGGQRQRICIARVLAMDPEFIILDESVSALDVSIRAQILNLLEELQDEFNLTYLFISHDLNVVKHISDVVIVMYLGKIMEISPKEEFYNRPYHPYSEALLSATPKSHPSEKRERIILKGEPPSPANPPSGCVFHTRCKNVLPICKEKAPNLDLIYENSSRRVACYNPVN